MKYLILILSMTYSAMAYSSVPSEAYHWVNTTEKTVQFAATPKLQVTLQKVDLDRETKGILWITLEYDSEIIKQTAADLKEQYPGYQVLMARLSKIDDYEIDVPALDIENMQVTTYPGQVGPYFQSILNVGRKQIKDLEWAIKTAPHKVVNINGEHIAHVKKRKVLESKSLPLSTCDQLADGGDLYSAMSEYSNILQKVRRMSFRYSSTLKQLEKNILVSCLNINVGSGVNSFTELLERQVFVRSDAQAPKGEAVRTDWGSEYIQPKVKVFTEITEENS